MSVIPPNDLLSETDQLLMSIENNPIGMSVKPQPQMPIQNSPVAPGDFGAANPLYQESQDVLKPQSWGEAFRRNVTDSILNAVSPIVGKHNAKSIGKVISGEDFGIGAMDAIGGPTAIAAATADAEASAAQGAGPLERVLMGAAIPLAAAPIVGGTMKGVTQAAAKGVGKVSNLLEQLKVGINKAIANNDMQEAQKLATEASKIISDPNNGLITPVVKTYDKMTVDELSDEMHKAIQQADNSLKNNDKIGYDEALVNIESIAQSSKGKNIQHPYYLPFNEAKSHYDYGLKQVDEMDQSDWYAPGDYGKEAEEFFTTKEQLLPPEEWIKQEGHPALVKLYRANTEFSPVYIKNPKDSTEQHINNIIQYKHNTKQGFFANAEAENVLDEFAIPQDDRGWLPLRAIPHPDPDIQQLRTEFTGSDKPLVTFHGGGYIQDRIAPGSHRKIGQDTKHEFKENYELGRTGGRLQDQFGLHTGTPTQAYIFAAKRGEDGHIIPVVMKETVDIREGLDNLASRLEDSGFPRDKRLDVVISHANENQGLIREEYIDVIDDVLDDAIRHDNPNLDFKSKMLLKKTLLISSGITNIPYINMKESAGDVSYWILTPEFVRNPWAEFKPGIKYLDPTTPISEGHPLTTLAKVPSSRDLLYGAIPVASLVGASQLAPSEAEAQTVNRLDRETEDAAR